MPLPAPRMPIHGPLASRTAAIPDAVPHLLQEWCNYALGAAALSATDTASLMVRSTLPKVRLPAQRGSAGRTAQPNLPAASQDG